MRRLGVREKSDERILGSGEFEGNWGTSLTNWTKPHMDANILYKRGRLCQHKPGCGNIREVLNI